MDLFTWQQTTIVNVMTPDEARYCVDEINKQLLSARELIYDLWNREGWRALGYANWTDCVNNEFKEVSTRQVWREFAAAKIENLLTERSVGQIPETHLRPLTSLEPEQQVEAWQQAIDTAPDGKMTAAHVQQVVDEIKNKPHVSHNSGNNEWYTPPEYIEAARIVLGGIDLDPASNSIANEIVQADKYYTPETNGLDMEWAGRIWMNPPYSQPEIEQFSEKLTACIESGVVTEAIVLVNNATETYWFQNMLAYCEAICLIRGRVRFLDPEGNPTGAPLQGQALLYFGANREKFAEAYSNNGTILYGTRWGI